MIVTLVEWTRAPLVPVTVTLYTPEDPEQDRVDVPLVVVRVRVIVVGVRVHDRPDDGEIKELSVTVPGNALSD